MYRKLLKRFFDLLISIAIFPFCALTWLIIAPFIYFEDKGTVFYISERIGKDGKPYKMYKLRSMKMNSEDIRNPDGSTYNGKDDLRLTKVGKFIRKTSLDETAQVLNVIKGDMSWIGPRPATPKILENLDDLKRARFAVRPGITGYTQMKYRNSAQGVLRYEADKFYVENLSFWLDLKIIFGTVKKVLGRSDVYNVVSVEQPQPEKEKVHK